MSQKIPLALSYNDVLLVPQRSLIDSRSEVDLKTPLTKKIALGLPLISINMTDVTGVEMAIGLAKLGGIGFLPRFIPAEKQADMINQVKKAGLLVGAAVGARDEEIKRAEIISKANPDIITLDVAHGHMEKAINMTKMLKLKYGKNIEIVSGVVATYEGAHDLFKAGADSVRIGVGPGTICITRVVTGIGVPQITAVMEGARAAKKFGRTIICDGGTSNSGDVMKGLAAGAHAVIIGSQFAGTDEAPGKMVVVNNVKYKQYNASTSSAEKQKHVTNGTNNSRNYLNHIEGVESLVTYKGPLLGVISKMEANLRAGFSYCGAKNIAELHKRARFIQITQGGMNESNFHNVIAQKFS